MVAVESWTEIKELEEEDEDEGDDATRRHNLTERRDFMYAANNVVAALRSQSK